MTMLRCEPVTGTEDRPVDEATDAARAWVSQQLRFERLLGSWRAAGEAAREAAPDHDVRQE